MSINTDKIEESLKLIYNHLDKLSGRINGLETRFDHNTESNGKIIAELAKEVDALKHPDLYYQIVRRL